jgi:hypothetical protein
MTLPRPIHRAPKAKCEAGGVVVSVRILIGNAHSQLELLPANIAHCIVAAEGESA